MKTKINWLVSLIIVGGGLNYLWPASPKIGYVDIQKVFEEYSSAQEVKKQLERELKQKEKELKVLEKEILAIKEVLNTNIMLTEAAKKKREKELAEKESAYLELFKKYQAELAEKEKDALKEIEKEIIEKIEKIGKKEGYTIILNKSLGGVLYVLYAQPKLDLTARIIKMLNQDENKKKK
jgi:outer membrane protein